MTDKNSVKAWIVESCDAPLFWTGNRIEFAGAERAIRFARFEDALMAVKKLFPQQAEHIAMMVVEHEFFLGEGVRSRSARCEYEFFEPMCWRDGPCSSSWPEVACITFGDCPTRFHEASVCPFCCRMSCVHCGARTASDWCDHEVDERHPHGCEPTTSYCERRGGR
jgi:hypothetical protein